MFLFPMAAAAAAAVNSDPSKRYETGVPMSMPVPVPVLGAPAPQSPALPPSAIPTKKRKSPSSSSSSSSSSAAPNANGQAPPAKKRNSAKKTALTLKAFTKKLHSVPHDELTNIVAEFVMRKKLVNELVGLLPVPEVNPLIEELEDASSSINRALPYSPYGSNRDHHAYKRASPCCTAFKSLLDKHLKTLLDNGDYNIAASYIVSATDVIPNCVTFDAPSDNKYKQLCYKKLDVAAKKVLKAKDLSADVRSELEHLDFDHMIANIMDN